MGKNPLCNARDRGSISSLGTKIPHAAEQLSLGTVTTEPVSANRVFTLQERSFMTQSKSCMLQLRPKYNQINK